MSYIINSFKYVVASVTSYISEIYSIGGGLADYSTLYAIGEEQFKE